MPREVCPPNPYFYGWIKEQKDGAKEKDNKSVHSYSRALKALSQYPIPLRSGEEAKVIKNVGDKMARYLDKKVKEFYRERGYRDTEIDHFMISCSLEKLPTVREKLTKKMVTNSRKRKKLSPPEHEYGQGSSVAEPEDTSTKPLKQPRTQPPAGDPNDVMAQLDTILGQVEQELNPVPVETRTITIAEQPSSNVKCVRPGENPIMIRSRSPSPQQRSIPKQRSSPSGKHIPQFSFMSSGPSTSNVTSPPRGDIRRQARSPLPVRSMSPELGSQITALYSVQATDGDDSLVGWSPPPSCSFLEDEEIELLPARDAEPQLDSIPVGQWWYVYLDNGGHETKSRGRAALLESGDLDMTGLWLRARTFKETLHQTDKLFMDNESNNQGSDNPLHRDIYIEASSCEMMAPGLPKVRTKSSTTTDKKRNPTKSVEKKIPMGLPDISDSDDDIPVLSLPPPDPESNSVRNDNETSAAPGGLPMNDSAAFDSWWDDDRLSQVIKEGLKTPAKPATTNDLKKQPKGKERQTRKDDRPYDIDVAPRSNGQSYSNPHILHTVTADHRTGVTEKEDVVKNAPVIFKMSPRSFTVSLCVDNAEVTKKQQLILELKKNGVDHNVRKLQVGDFLWVARDGQGRELVLDTVIERKRMDDLAQSITGGRFAEQKLRLKSCGLPKKIYLVETKASYLSLPETSLNQAVVNTQVIDGFTIKKTADIKDSAGYLTILTRYLSNKFKDRELHGIEDPECTSDNHLLTFEAFSKNSIKNRVFSVEEVWMKQLTRVPKISQDKAEAIVQVYPTPHHLMTAINSLPDPDTIVSDIKFGIAKRKIGVAASRSLAGLFSKQPLH